MDIEDKKRLGEELKRLRIENNYTLEELGNVFGVTHKSVQFWEQGKNEIKLGTLLKLAKFYNVSIDEILDNAGL